MGLASALSTALTGMTAAETTIDVVGNNLANSNTVGFKASQASFATQFLQTQSLGSGPTSNSGGTNPRQVGLGTMVADITPNFSQGTIETSSSPTDLAIQGEGFFIVQGSSNQDLYTRNGVFKTNAQNELVTSTGNALLGYGVDSQYRIQSTSLTPLTIPLGAKSVSSPTATAYLQGTLSPTGDIADTAGIIKTATLSDAAFSRPDTVFTASTPTSLGWGSTAITQNPVAGSQVPNNTYYYKIVYADGPNGTANATEGTATAASAAVTVAGGPTTVAVSGAPVDSNYSYARLYRTSGDPQTGNYYYVGETATGFAASGVSASSASGGQLKAGQTYSYRFAWATGPNATDAEAPEGVSSAASAVTGTVANVGNAIQLSGLDAMPSNPDPTKYTSLHIYRTQNDQSSGAYSDYFFVAGVPASQTTYVDGADDSTLTQKLAPTVSFTDNSTDPPSSQKLDQSSTLTGSYSYYVTFVNANGLESRPSDRVDVTASNGRIHLTNFPVGDTSQWTSMRIYRSRNGDSSNFYRIAEMTGPDALDGKATYTDTASDDAITDPTKTMSFNGPPIQNGTLLSNILRRDGDTTYTNVFDIPPEDNGNATLQFTGTKGGRTLSMEQFSITANSTAEDLAKFLENSLGIQRPPGSDAAHPIPQSKNPVVGGPPLDAGALVDAATGQIEIISNNGTGNSVGVDLSAMKLITSKSSTSVNMQFTSAQTAVGESASTDMIAYDSLGMPCNVHLTAVLQSRTSALTTYRWFADSPDNSPQSGIKTAVGTGLITFDGQGNYVTSYGDTVSIDRANLPSSSPLEFKLDFSQLSGLASTNGSSLSVARQDGSAPGTLTSFIVGQDGLISGVFSNGITRDLGQIRLARFSNPAGLQQMGQNMFSAGVNSGLPVEGNPNEQGTGSIIAGAQELSNTDIGGNLIDLILASTMYRGNSQVISTIQTMLDTLLSLRR